MWTLTEKNMESDHACQKGYDRKEVKAMNELAENYKTN